MYHRGQLDDLAWRFEVAERVLCYDRTLGLFSQNVCPKRKKTLMSLLFP